MEDFTLGLALLDACPVLFFGISVLLIATKFNNTLFLIGALLSFLAGLGKVLWKLIWAFQKKDIRILSNQFKYSMSTGFLCMVISVILAKVSMVGIFKRMCQMPSVIFFGLGIIGMCIMAYMSQKYSRTDAKANWIEEVINTAAQLCFLIGIALL